MSPHVQPGFLLVLWAGQSLLLTITKPLRYAFGGLARRGRFYLTLQQGTEDYEPHSYSHDRAHRPQPQGR
jgi:hypothetical protein